MGLKIIKSFGPAFPYVEERRYNLYSLRKDFQDLKKVKALKGLKLCEP